MVRRATFPAIMPGNTGLAMGRTFYDDNYGHVEIESEEDLEFYRETQRQSVRKKCKRCKRWVKIKREYALCNSCADAIERGGDY